VELASTPCRARLPFRFGASLVTGADLLTCRVRCETGDGRSSHGWSADLLVPRWFRKDLARTPEQDAAALVASAERAAAAFVGGPAQSPFRLWWQAFTQCLSGTAPDAPDLLERGFGVALVERAVLDAACRRAAVPFPRALRDDLFGFEPAAVDPGLAGWDWQRSLPEPRRSIAVRHTVGMLDPLRARELAPGQRIGDGLPQALDEYIAAHGLRWFKVKVGQGPAADRARLLQLAALFADLDLAPGLTLDGNEQFADLGALAELLAGVAAEPAGRRLLHGLRWIEQPLARKPASAPAPADLARVTAFAPLVLDEGDALPDSFARAAASGYRGVSVKACKGVFRALCNFGRCLRTPGLFQTGEDLTNLPVLALQQDLCLAAVLGLEHVERNGHHYFRGLDHLPAALQQAALVRHPDLYRASGAGACLRIDGGALQLDSVLAAPGFAQSLDGHAVDLRSCGPA
jgi:L-alanine-DL-glutamate epimerase-like enolase superfamily enzyme